MAQISIAWLLQQDPVAAPVFGTTNLENLYDTIG
jgi:aryl-alcohol dehydrogenase-like predicted oxidoreductase